MEQINNLVTKIDPRQHGADAWNDTLPLQQNSTTRQITLAYGSREQFLQTFHFSQQGRHTVPELVERCVVGRAPTLTEVNMTYGEGTAEFWLTLQLTDLSEFCGCREKMSDFQLRQLAQLIKSTYFHLKVTELELFFHRFKLCHYGQFYGTVDPMVITRSLRQFMNDRANIIDEYDRRIREQQREEWARRAVPPPEHSWLDKLKH